MSYAVETTGTLHLPESLERQALTVLEVELVARQGPFEDVAAVDTLPDLATVAGAEVRREGDWLQLTTASGADREWSDQATAFYVGLARWVQQGEVHLVGQDGARWSYRYGPDGVIQVGQNGWDGSLIPFGEPVSSTSGPSTPASSSPAPAHSPVFLTLVFLVGLVLIVGVAMLASGL
jgi:hypothetical protein